MLRLTRRGEGGEFGANEAHGGGSLALMRRTRGGGGVGANEGHRGEFGATEVHGGGGGGVGANEVHGGGGGGADKACSPHTRPCIHKAVHMQGCA